LWPFLIGIATGGLAVLMARGSGNRASLETPPRPIALSSQQKEEVDGLLSRNKLIAAI